MRWRAILAVSLLAIAACKAARTATPVTLAEANSEKAVDEPNRDLPADLYKEMPIFPGAMIEHVRKPTRKMREILFSTEAELSQIVAYYKEQLKAKNFHVTSALIMPARKTWSCSFDLKGRLGNIMLYPSEQNKSRMTIALMYELPTKRNDSLLEPKENFDVVGPGEILRAISKPTEKAMNEQ